jgi:hypothetical protein
VYPGPAGPLRHLGLGAKFYLRCVVVVGLLLAAFWSVAYWRSASEMRAWISGVLLPVGLVVFAVAVVALVVLKRLEDRYL